MKSIISWLTVDRYYKMSDAELEKEASKLNIGEYGCADGCISRKIIIEQLIQRHKANNSRFAIFIAAISFLVSIIGLFIS